MKLEEVERRREKEDWLGAEVRENREMQRKERWEMIG